MSLGVLGTELNRELYFSEEMVRNSMLALNLLQCLHLFRAARLCRVHIFNNGRYHPCDAGEAQDNSDFEDNTDNELDCGVAVDVS